VFKGTRASFSMPARRPRWVGDETRVLKADWRSWDAGYGSQNSRLSLRSVDGELYLKCQTA
jgi:hypothetical protein